MGQNHWSIYVLYVPYYRSVGKTETVAGEWFRVWQAVSSLWRSSGVITLLSILLKTDLSLCNSILSWFHFKFSKSNFKLICFFCFCFSRYACRLWLHVFASYVSVSRSFCSMCCKNRSDGSQAVTIWPVTAIFLQCPSLRSCLQGQHKLYNIIKMIVIIHSH